ncbi:N-6 DNA methylase, partial [Streptomyces niveus]
MQEIKTALWEAADRLRGSVDAMDLPEYVGGLIFLKYVSDEFAANRSELRARLVAEAYDEDRIEELLEEPEFTDGPVIWVPRSARWPWINTLKDTGHIGEVIDDAMNAIMQANPSLLGALPTVFRDGTADQERLTEVVALIGRVRFTSAEERPARDVLGEAYEFLLDRFGGDSRSPRSVGRLLVGILEPSGGRVYDPACGSGGLLAQAGTFMAAHRGAPAAGTAFFGQEINERAWRLAGMNLAAHGFEYDLGTRWGDALADDEHPDLKADFVMAQPPIGFWKWSGNGDDPRWTYRDANYAWLQHAVSKLSDLGTAGVVLEKGSLLSRSPAETRIRQALVEADL